MTINGFQPIGHGPIPEPSSPATPESELRAYQQENLKEVMTFLEQRGAQFSVTLTQQQVDEAPYLGDGVTGAKLIEIEGKKYVLKLPVLAEQFQLSYDVARANMAPEEITHFDIASSVDPFVDFPRKEVVGSLLLNGFLPEGPKAATALIKVDGAEKYGSLQPLLTKSDGTPLPTLGVMEDSGLRAEAFDYDTSMRLCMFTIVSENKDPHSGNVLAEEVEGALLKPHAIDFGLILSEPVSLYTSQKAFMINRGIFGLYIEKTLSKEMLRELKYCYLPDNALALAKPHEREKLELNFEVLQECLDDALKLEEDLNLYDFFIMFLNKRDSK